METNHFGLYRKIVNFTEVTRYVRLHCPPIIDISIITLFVFYFLLIRYLFWYIRREALYSNFIIIKYKPKKLSEIFNYATMRLLKQCVQCSIALRLGIKMLANGLMDSKQIPNSFFERPLF